MNPSVPAALAARLADLRSRIPGHTRLVAVSKTHPAMQVREAYDLGLRDFGENRVQEAIAKQQELGALPGITWHLLGPLQSNKARKAMAAFDWIHSLDSLELAQRLDRLAAELGRSPTLLLQVKLRPDPNKSGWEPAALRAALPELDALAHLRICGLMVIPPLGLSADETRAVFAEARELAAEIAAGPWQRLRMEELSLGMSGDFEAAIAEGSTCVRLGTALFGQR